MVRTVLPACQSHTRITLSSPAETSCLPSGVKARPLMSAICPPGSSIRIGTTPGSAACALGRSATVTATRRSRPPERNSEPYVSALWLACDRRLEACACLDLDAVDQVDNVARLEPRLVGRGAGRNQPDLGATRTIPAELVGLRLGDILNVGADPPPGLMRPRRATRQQRQHHSQQTDSRPHQCTPSHQHAQCTP